MSFFVDTEIIEINLKKIVKIPFEVSDLFPSRGMVMANIKLSSFWITKALEPDGKGSHWFELDAADGKKLDVSMGKKLQFEIEIIDDWMEPPMPKDFRKKMKDMNLDLKWDCLTVKARWDWIRWIRATNNPKTCKKRMEVACSKLQKGDKRPCCFDRTRCTIPEVSTSGILRI